MDLFVSNMADTENVKSYMLHKWLKMSIFYTSGLNRQYSIQVAKNVNILYKWSFSELQIVITFEPLHRFKKN
jgi:hypothetical protein